jgi:hypothetical protein
MAAQEHVETAALKIEIVIDLHKSFWYGQISSQFRPTYRAWQVHMNMKWINYVYAQ